MSWVDSLSQTPMPTILVIAGLFFIFLSISGGISGKVQIPLTRQWQSGIAGGILLVIGLAIYIIPGFNEPGSGPVGVQPVHDPDPGPEPTPLPEPILDEWKVIHGPDFFSANRHWKENDLKYDDYHITRKLVNGAATIFIQDIGTRESGGSWERTNIPVEPVLNFEISADFKWLKKNTKINCIGFAFRDKGAEFYLFRLCDNAKVDFYDYVESADDKWKFYRSTNIYQLYRDDVNNLKVRAHDEKMYFYVNDKLVLEMKDSAPAAGNISIYQDTDKKSALKIAVDNIYLRAPE